MECVELMGMVGEVMRAEFNRFSCDIERRGEKGYINILGTNFRAHQQFKDLSP